MGVRQFHEIFELEVTAISARRKNHHRPKVSLEDERLLPDGTPIKRPNPDSELVGLALSGGGIRSSAFCLGAMQALDHHGLIEKIDYLSTVSGGGYIGTSMTAAMSMMTKEEFPFPSRLREGEPLGLQHIRDHSNYLFPQGLISIVSNLAVYLRGILANILLLLPWLLLAAVATILAHPSYPQSLSHFRLTLSVLVSFIILLALWALWRSTTWGRNLSDIGLSAKAFGVAWSLIVPLAFVQLQPLLLSEMFRIARSPDGASILLDAPVSWLKTLAAFLAAIGAVTGFLGRFLADALKRATERQGFTSSVKRIILKFTMYLAGAAVPLALWVVYLYLSFWGIEDCTYSCVYRTPEWLRGIASSVTRYAPQMQTILPNSIQPTGWDILCLYFVAMISMLVIGLLLSPNANSLHQLYRERLANAFLFNPNKQRLKQRAGVRTAELESLENLRLSELRTDIAPYQLINTALNVEASPFANRRGRNADFFVFSSLFTGSESTGYIETRKMGEEVSGLTVATAMAVSGAAASSNMGSATIRPLVPTLALLNVRLGFWLTNPANVGGPLKRPFIRLLFDRMYFFHEMFGLLTEKSKTVYLTDGGHIENLGIYELLRRRCKLIIAIDAEADPDMSFRSFVTLQRYARIDFGIRIDLPWAAIRDVHREAAAEILKSGGSPPNNAPHGPHCALGTIYYPRMACVPEEDEAHPPATAPEHHVHFKTRGRAAARIPALAPGPRT
jgi:predicted acylesterase/phospholipase RssA